jgi:hypothetical protein
LQDARFIYEWDVSFTFHPETPGEPRYDLPHKVEGQHRALFPPGQFIGEAAGEALWHWANSDAAATRSPPLPQTDERRSDEDSAPTSPSIPLANEPPESAARQAARAFTDELIAEIGKTDPNQIRLMLEQKAVRLRLDRLREDHTDLHDAVMAAVGAQTREARPG